MTEVERTRQMYQRVFSSSSGQQVLADILNDCGFFSMQDIERPEDLARLNVARRILSKMGVWTEENVFSITGTLLGGENGLLQRLLSLPKGEYE